jgi:DNA-binding response OmpR family regulator
MPSKTKILAISRDPILVNFLQRELNDDGYQVVSTHHNGIQLKNIIDNECPAFIILDIVMPSLDGVGLCLQLRQWTQTPVLMLSTWNTDNGKVRGLNLSSDSYVTEPFGVETLKKRIKYTLKRNDMSTLLPNVRIGNN